MKHLELNLNKRLLIVESEADYFGYKDYRLKLICKGSELNEDIAKGFIPIDEKEARIKHPKAFLISYKRFQNAFIDVVESNGWYWGDPLGISTEEIRQRHGDASDMFNEWVNYESRTFNPEKCLIFEIL